MSVKLEQGLIDWLNSNSKNDSVEGLLLAPIAGTSEPPHELEDALADSEQPHDLEDGLTDSESPQELTTPAASEPAHEPAPTLTDSQPPHAPAGTLADLPPSHEPDNTQELHAIIGLPHQLNEAQEISRELVALKAQAESLKDSHHELNLNKAWHEASQGLELNLQEPPPELWTNINEQDEDSDSDSDSESYSEDYEHVILQQDASVTLHGTNFTQRLQRTLQGRKNKAAELKRRNSELGRHSHPYIRHSLMMCGVLLLVIGLLWLALSYLRTKTPDSYNARASELFEQGKFDEAMSVYQEAYQRYPDVLTFLTGIARSAEKSGKNQTAAIAWDEYKSSIPKTESASINVNTGGDTRKQEQKKEPGRRLSFSEYLREGNNAYNLGIYNSALMNFFQALELRSNDARPYIGIAGAYRAKGMYFDAFRILIEAGKRFRRDPTIETGIKILEGE